MNPVSLTAGRYIRDWLEQHPVLTDSQIDQLVDTYAEGCIGILEMRLGLPKGGIPDMSNCYTTFQAAHKRMEEMRKDCVCQKKGKDAYGRPASPVMFAYQSWYDLSANDPDVTVGSDGHITMREGERFNPRKSWGGVFAVNFNFATYDESSDSFVYANYGGSGQTIVNMPRGQFTGNGFKSTVYCVACENWQFGGFATLPSNPIPPRLPPPSDGKKWKGW